MIEKFLEHSEYVGREAFVCVSVSTSLLVAVGGWGEMHLYELQPSTEPLDVCFAHLGAIAILLVLGSKGV